MIYIHMLWMCYVSGTYVVGSLPSMTGRVYNRMTYNSTGTVLARLTIKNELLCAAQCANQFSSCNTAVFDSSIVPQCLLFNEIVIPANLVISINAVVYDFRQTSTLSFHWNTTGTTMLGSSMGTAGVAANQLSHTYGLALGSSNSLYIADFGNNRIQKFLVDISNATTVAGLANGTYGASATAIHSPVSVVLDSNDNMYFTDRNNHRVMFWANNAFSGTMIAGTGSLGNTSTTLNYPCGLARDSSSGTLYIADTYNHRIMMYLANASSGTVVAGGNGPGDSSTQLWQPYGFTFDSSSNSLLIANYGTHNVVRWILGESSWTLVAGITGVSGNTSALLNQPISVTLDSIGNMFVADSGNHRIQFFLAGQSNGTTTAGMTGSPGTSPSQLNHPYWAILDNQMNLYVADTYNNRVQLFSHH